jgi:hypothetical protein
VADVDTVFPAATSGRRQSPATPGRLLTAADQERWQRFPDEITRDDLSAYFTLSAADLREIGCQRGDANRLGFAFQLCALRFLGFVPDDLASAPAVVLYFIAHQLGVDAGAVHRYGQRSHTRTDHLLRAQAYLGFRKATPADWESLAQWLLARALEHDKPTLLLQLACEHWHRHQIVRPGLSRLERRVMIARRQAQEETYRRLLPLMTPSRRAWLDALLEPQANTGRTCLTWLRAPASAATAPQICATLEKIAFLQDTGVADWDLGALNPNRIQWLARIGRKATNQSLQRAPVKRRYPILIAFLKQALLSLTDDTVEMVDQCLWDCHTDAKKDLEAFRQRAAAAINDNLKRFRDLSQVLLDPDIADAAVRAVSFQRVSAETLRTALAETEQLIRPSHDASVDFFGRRYSYLRQFIPALLRQLTFRSSRGDDPLLAAIDLLRALDAAPTRQALPADAPMSFMPAAWRAYVVDREGHISRRYYELCTLWMLRQALRAGDVWVEHSRRYADPDTYLIPVTEWPARRWR